MRLQRLLLARPVPRLADVAAGTIGTVSNRGPSDSDSIYCSTTHFFFSFDQVAVILGVMGPQQIVLSAAAFSSFLTSLGPV